MIILIGDENPTQRKPYVNYTLIGLNILIFYLLNFQSDFDQIVQKFGWTPARRNFITLFTSMFMHANIFHILGNMLYLWIFGDNVEDALGPYFYIAFYLLAGISGSILHTLSYPNSPIPCIGASGAISGALGFYLIFFSWHRVKVFIFGAGTYYLQALWAIGFWFVMQLFLGLMTAGTPVGVAYWAHIGGFIFGITIAVLWKIMYLREQKRDIMLVTGGKVPAEEPVRTIKEDSYITLEKGVTPGNEANYLQAYDQIVRLYGARRVKPEHHLKAGEIFSQRDKLNKAVEIYERFLLSYPEHPLAPKFRYYLGRLFIHQLNRPGKGLRYLRRAMKDSGEGYSSAEARKELQSLTDKEGDTEESYMKCPKCGYENKEDVISCNLCGEVLKRTGDLAEKREGIISETEPTTPDIPCSNHPMRSAEGFCQVCKKDFCSECLQGAMGSGICVACQTKGYTKAVSRITKGYWTQFLILAVCFIGLVWIIIFHWKAGKIPDVTLEDIKGNVVSLKETDNKEFGVIMYLSNAPCGSHPRMAGIITNFYPFVEQSNRYHPIFIYGDSTQSLSKSFAEKYDVPILLDGGKRVAKKLKIDRYYALIIFRSNGKIIFRRDGSFPYPRFPEQVIDMLDHFIE